MQIELWENNQFGNDKKRIIFADEIEEVANFEPEGVYLIEGIDSKKGTELTTRYKKEIESETTECIYDKEDLAEWLEQQGYKNFSIEHNEAPEVKDVLAFSNGEFFNLYDCVTTRQCKYWDGSNWGVFRTNEFFPVLTISKEYISLDEWDGNNHNAGGRFNHLHVHKVLEVDDEKRDDLYLFYYHSQWRGSLPTGKLVQVTALNSAIKSIEDNHVRNIGNYVESIKALKE